MINSYMGRELDLLPVSDIPPKGLYKGDVTLPGYYLGKYRSIDAQSDEV